MPPRTQPWLLVVMTSTYTSNPPSNAAAFKAWLERTAPGTGSWRNCRYLVWGLGNTQWNAFLAFPRYVHAKLAELGATPLAGLGYGDVGTPAWEHLHATWNSQVWPLLLELSGRPADRGRGRARRRRERDGGRADRHRLRHRDAQVALRRRRRDPAGAAPGDRHVDHAAAGPAGRGPGRVAVTGAAGAGHPDQRGRGPHGRGARAGLPGPRSGAGGRAASGRGSWISACRPASPTGPGTTSAYAPKMMTNGSTGLPGCSALPSMACSWRRRAWTSVPSPRASCSRSATCSPAWSTSAAGRACRCSTCCSRRRPTPASGRAWPRSGTSWPPRTARGHRCGRRSTRAATTCSGCLRSSRRAR